MLWDCSVPTFCSCHLFTLNESLDPAGSVISEALGAIPTTGRNNYRDFESSVLGLSVMAFVVTAQGAENVCVWGGVWKFGARLF